LKNKAIKIDKMYTLISYRFFIVLDNPQVREVIAKKEPSFDSIVKMYTDFNSYRIKKKRSDPYNGFKEKNDLKTWLDEKKKSKAPQAIQCDRENVLANG
jgi:hypothetical protein